MIASNPNVISQVATQPLTSPRATPKVGLEQYYSEAGPDYAAWSREFNMHFGFFRFAANPLDREAMLEQMNAEVLQRLHLAGIAKPHLLDLGCGLGATLRSFSRRLPHARLVGLTPVPWQVEHARALNQAAGCGVQVRVLEGDYENSLLSSASYDGIYALESSGMRTVQTKAHCSQRHTVCCGPAGVSLSQTDFSPPPG